MIAISTLVYDEIFMSHIKAIANTIAIPTILTITSGAILTGIVWIIFMAIVYQIVDKPLNKKYFYIYSGWIAYTATLFLAFMYVILKAKGV